MDGTYHIIHFEDGYQMDLVDKYGWSEHQAENEVEKLIEKNLQKKGLDCQLNWEDREIFLIEKPNFSVHEVANVLMTMFEIFFQKY